MPQLTFYGAAGTVTGSKYLLEAGSAKVLIDCGLFQGLKYLRELNWKPLPFAASSVDAVVLTHAHIDHTGYLPKFYAQGYRGPILATPATRRLCDLLLPDAAVNQERDADYANREGYTKHRPALPLYSVADARDTLKLFQSRPRDKWHQAAGPIWFRYHDAGHLLGSAMIEVEIREGATPVRVLFSGDVGRYHGPLYHDPMPPPACDVLICESTYGDRDHPDDDMLSALQNVTLNSIRRGGVMLVAAFAVGRAQQLIYLLEILMEQKRIPSIPIFLDSPMAANATQIYRDFRVDHDLEEGAESGLERALQSPQLTLARSSDESKRINRVAGPAVIIASSGMMTGGRILHHLKQRLPDAKNTVLIGGYQAEGTRGRRLQDGEKTMRIYGQDVPVRAAIEKVSGLSGHAGKSELLRWLAPLPPPREVYLTHGEPAAMESLATALRAERNWEVILPRLGDKVEL